MIIAVGEYAEFQWPVKTPVPLAYYVPQTDREPASRGFSSAPQTLEFFHDVASEKATAPGDERATSFKRKC